MIWVISNLTKLQTISNGSRFNQLVDKISMRWYSTKFTKEVVLVDKISMRWYSTKFTKVDVLVDKISMRWYSTKSTKVDVLVDKTSMRWYSTMFTNTGQNIWCENEMWWEKKMFFLKL